MILIEFVRKTVLLCTLFLFSICLSVSISFIINQSDEECNAKIYNKLHSMQNSDYISNDCATYPTLVNYEQYLSSKVSKDLSNLRKRQQVLNAYSHDFKSNNRYCLSIGTDTQSISYSEVSNTLTLDADDLQANIEISLNKSSFKLSTDEYYITPKDLVVEQTGETYFVSPLIEEIGYICIMKDMDLLYYVEVQSPKQDIMPQVTHMTYSFDKNSNSTYDLDTNPLELPIMLQTDSRWCNYPYPYNGSGTIGDSGCGVLSATIVINGLTKQNYSPTYIADLSLANGWRVSVGTSHSLFTQGMSQFGIQANPIDVNVTSVINSLRDGKPIIASMGTGYFTNSGHLIVIRGLDKANECVYVCDPYNIDNNSKSFKVQDIVAESNNMYECDLIAN